MDALSTTKTMKAEMKALKVGIEVGGPLSLDRYRSPRLMLPSKLKSICDVQEVENFQWCLEKYFEFNRLKRDENKIKSVT